MYRVHGCSNGWLCCRGRGNQTAVIHDADFAGTFTHWNRWTVDALNGSTKTDVPLLADEMVKGWFIIRTMSELASAICFVIAIVYASLSTSPAILQATPLAVSLAAALFLKQHVSLRQWLLIGIGFIGVICMGLDGFKLAALSAVLGVMFLALRDSITRSISVTIPAVSVSLGILRAFCAGILTIPFFGKFGVITGGDVGLLAISAWPERIFCIVMATRGGDVAVVAPFRYSFVVCPRIAGEFSSEQIDPMTILGSSLIIGSGLIITYQAARSGNDSTRALTSAALVSATVPSGNHMPFSKPMQMFRSRTE